MIVLEVGLGGRVPENRAVDFAGSTGDRLSLRVLGYEHPRYDSDEFDSNWLIVEVSASIDRRAWRAVEPCLLTWELEWIARWLESASGGEPFDRTLDLLEPCLCFEWVGRSGERTDFRVYVELECRPPWAKAMGAPHRDCWITLQADAEGLIRAAEDARSQRSAFPTRAGVGTSRDLPWAIQGLENQ